MLRKKLRGVVCWRWVRRQNAGGFANNIEGVCRRGIKKTKWGGAKKIEGGSMLERGKEDKMREAGVAKI